MKVEELPIPESVRRLFIENGIINLYPPQEKAIKADVLKGRNLVLATPTASGKTLIAELCAIKNIIEHNGRVLYLTPLRALASEKYEEFKKFTEIEKKNGQRISITISSGDYDSTDHWLGRYDLIIVTNEKCDSLLRHKADWIDEVTLVITDEIHILNDAARGPTLEVIITRLKEINPKIQILALSATINNAEEIAEWLNAKAILSEWRPVKLIEGVCCGDECQFSNGKSLKVEEYNRDSIVNMAIHTIKQRGQALIFAETRRRTVSIAKKMAIHVNQQLSKMEKRILNSLAKKIIGAGERTRINDLLAELVKNGVSFHHAGLKVFHRKIIEDAFREGRIKIICATPTLASGVNLPARMVIVSSYKRYEPGYGRVPISVLDYKQMAGRAGRPKYDKIGEAVLISKTKDEQDFLIQNYVFAKPERIWSKLAVENVLRSHVLACIASGSASSEERLYNFFRKTFYAYEYGAELILAMVSKTLKFLYAEEMIVFQQNNFKATSFGHRVSELYIDPVSGVIIRNGLNNGANFLTDLSLIHLICHTPDVKPKYYPRRREINELETYVDIHSDEFVFPIPNRNNMIEYESFLGEVKCASVLLSWTQEVSEDKIIEKYSVEPGDLFRLIDTTKWLLYTSQELGRLFRHRDVVPRISELREMVKKGVKRELLPIVRLEGIGRVRGRMLFKASLRTINDLKRASITQLINVPLIGPNVAKMIKEQVGGLIKRNE